MHIGRGQPAPVIVQVAVVAVVVASLLACQPPAASGPLLSDPREILARGIDASSTMRSVHLRADITMRRLIPGEPLAGPQGLTIDADVDFTTGNLAATGTDTTDGGRFGLIVLNDTTFTQSMGDGRWQQLPNMGGAGLLGFAFGMPGAPALDVVGLLRKLAADDGVDAALAAVDACGGATCYRVTVVIPPESLWDVVIEVLGRAAGGIGLGGVGEMPPGFPGVSLDLLFETSTVALVETRLAVSVEGGELSAIVRLSNHDAPITIQPPPPHLIEQMPGFGVGS